MQCTMCGSEIAQTSESQRYRLRKTGRVFCTKSCGMKHRESRRTTDWTAKSRQARPEGVTCIMCSAAADLSGFRLARFQQTGRAYCSPACSNIYRSQVSSKTMARTNSQYASDRMTKNNPMRSEVTRAKVSETLRLIGHAPTQRGGNGKPATVAEMALFVLFASEGFVLRPVIRTGVRRRNEYRVPTSYKPDLANFEFKVALEADGKSHHGERRTLDLKKDSFLNGLGWTVLRFTNGEILGDPSRVVTTVLSTISRLRGCTHTSPTE